jgi:hypothetical protein
MSLFRNNNLIQEDEGGVLSAIWILASNDENPIMTYRYLRLRLDLSDSCNVEELIKKHPELFRPGIPSWRLEGWKSKLLSGDKLPVWLKAIESEEEQKKKIGSLTSEDIFRSQFRADSDSPKSPIELIEWGLQHIERLRKAKIEQKETKQKWLKDGLIPVLSLLIALGTVGFSSYFQYRNIETQKELKEYELSFKPKQEGYANFMASLGIAFDIAARNSGAVNPSQKDSRSLVAQIRQMELAFFVLEPFLPAEDKKTIEDNLNAYKLLFN